MHVLKPVCVSRAVHRAARGERTARTRDGGYGDVHPPPGPGAAEQGSIQRQPRETGHRHRNTFRPEEAQLPGQKGTAGFF